MGTSITLGRVAGVRIGLNWSWLILLALVGWTLGASVFPEQTPHRGAVTYAAMAAAATVLFFASIVLHELGHALQAQRDGVEIEGITLWLFGGVARIRGSFPTAAAELRIAIAGPAVTLVLGVAFVGLALLPLGTAAGGVAAWLGYANLVLLAFNLLPALPLDGGRVLRALLWRRSRDFARATARAAAAGRGIGIGLVLLGLVLAGAGATVGGVWLAVLGWFVTGAATAEGRAGVARAALDGLRVHDAMIAAPVTVDADLPLEDLVDAVSARVRPFATYPVTSGGVTVGLLPYGAVARLPRASRRSRRVRDVMVPVATAPVVREDEPLLEAVEELATQPLHRALVRADGRIVGLLSGTDVRRLAEARARRPAPR